MSKRISEGAFSWGGEGVAMEAGIHKLLRLL